MKICDEDLSRVEPSPVKIGRNIDGEYGGVAESQARCLIDRVDTVGPGAAALREEATMSKERNAHQLCLAQGHYALRRGQFHL